MSDQHVAIVGGGSIGVAFAVVFARAGLVVRIQEVSDARRAAIPSEVATRLSDLSDHGLIDESADEVGARVSVHAGLDGALPGAQLVLECAPEREDLKRDIFARIEAVADTEAMLASASSAIPISHVAADLAARARCFVAHPGNPPYLLPVIELAPAPFTDPAIVDRAADLFSRCGLYPARLNRELEGFVFNRLQGALLREAYCLVRDGVVSVEDIDMLVRDGLGLRWSVVGPFEAVDLNTRGGIAAHAERMGPAYARMGAERGQNDPWTPDLIEAVTRARRAALPLDEWEARVRWRDLALMKRLRGTFLG